MQAILVKEEPNGPSQLIEVPVITNGQQRVNFPDIQQLRSMANQTIIIKGIDLIIAQVLSNGPITGLVTAPLAELAKMSLVIYCEGWEKAQFFPVLALNSMAVPTAAIPFGQSRVKFSNWFNVDWSKTYIQYSNTTVSAGAPYCLLLNVQYEKLNAEGVPIVGPS